jgi:lysophospholipase L1-like esterase
VKALRNILLALAATAFTLLCAEALLRVMEPGDQGAITHVAPTEAGRYSRPIPRARGMRAGRPVSVNQLGYRGYPYGPHRSPGSFRIQIFGDSHTFGIGAPDDQTYPAVMERALNAGQQNRYEVLNFGVPAHDFGSIVKHMTINVPAYHPDLAILTFHTGDIISTDIIIDNRPTSNRPPTVRFKQALLSKSYLSRLMIIYGAPAVRTLLQIQPPGEAIAEINEIERNGPHWQNFRTVTLRLKDEFLGQCTELAVVLFPPMIDFETNPAIRLHSLIRSWLIEHQIAVFDLLPTFQGSKRKATDLRATLLDSHPNEDGYSLAGEGVARFVDSVTDVGNAEGGSTCREGRLTGAVADGSR